MKPEVTTKKYVPYIGICALLLLLSCTSQGPVNREEAQSVSGDGISLDKALSGIAAYYVGNLPVHTHIALINFESESQLLSDYIFEELWIYFEDSRFFTMVDRQNLGLIEKELEYQYSGVVSDESLKSIGHQFGPQTLIYGTITPVGREFRLVVRATDVEKAVTSIRSATVAPDPRVAALLAKPSLDSAKPSNTREGVPMANALYSGTDNPWRFTVQTDKPGGNYRDGEYMTLRIHSEKDAWFKVTHIDVNGNAQVIYPVSLRDNNFIKAGETRQIPDNTRFRMTKPFGEEMILVGAYEKPFVIPPVLTGLLSNNLLVRGITVEQEDTRLDMRPLATAKFTYRIEP